MRINQFVAKATGLSRRTVDNYIGQQRIYVNNQLATLGQNISDKDLVKLDDREITSLEEPITILFNKPVGYICSQNGQGSPTIYELIPSRFSNLQSAGRLDKDSSGIMVLTNDGDLAYKLTHPKFKKIKVYELRLDKELRPEDQKLIEAGLVKIDGRPSQIYFRKSLVSRTAWEVMIHEGRNRQIRKTFELLGYKVRSLNRSQMGPFKLSDLKGKSYIKLEKTTEI